MGGYSSQNDSTHQTGLCQSMSYINFLRVHKLTLTQQCVFAQINVKKQTTPVLNPRFFTGLSKFNFQKWLFEPPGAFESAWTSSESRENADFRGKDGQFGLGEDGHQTGVH